MLIQVHITFAFYYIIYRISILFFHREPIHCAARLCLIQMIEFLVSQGVNINAQTTDGIIILYFIGLLSMKQHQQQMKKQRKIS